MSTTVSTLRKRLEQTSEMVMRARKQVQGQDNFVTRASLASIESMQSQLQTDLDAAINDRGVEVLSLHLDGEQAKGGALPLHLVSLISDRLYRGLYAAAAYVRSGELMTRISQNLASSLDLRLADIQPGSTELLISARSQSNLFGDSLAGQTFESTIALLRSTQSGSLDEGIALVGPTATKHVRSLLDVVDKGGLSVDISWTDSELATHRWEGNSRSIEVARQTLALREEMAEELTLQAYVEGMNLRGRLELRPLGGDGEPFDEIGNPYGRLIYVRYGADTVERVRALSLGDHVTAKVLHTEYRNSITGRTQNTTFLRAIRPIEPY